MSQDAPRIMLGPSVDQAKVDPLTEQIATYHEEVSKKAEELAKLLGANSVTVLTTKLFTDADGEEYSVLGYAQEGSWHTNLGALHELLYLQTSRIAPQR